MVNHRKDCFVCGKELKYGKTQKLECFFCNKIHDSKVRCKDGHFVCDKCHSMSGNELIEQYCVLSKLDKPLKLALLLMRNIKIKIHGPEHHFLVPAVLLTAYYNTKGNYEEKKLKIKEARLRASQVLGGFCGYHGDCGAAVGTGIFISIITDSTPLSTLGWRLSNMMTAKSLFSIAKHGGPRCCKRNVFLAITEAVLFLKEEFDVKLSIQDKIQCEFYELNKECLKNKCLFYPFS